MHGAVTDSAPAVDPVAFRRALGRFATGVTVITALTPDGAPAGCTVSAFCSVSMDPPLVLACIGRGRSMHRTLAEVTGFAVNILRSDQADLARCFARSGADRFTGVATRPAPDGVPLLDGTIASLRCERHELLEGGDHTIVLGRVVDLHVDEGEPLLYSRGAFLDLPEPDWQRALATAPHEWLLSAPW